MLVLVRLVAFGLIDVAEVYDAATALHLVPAPVERPVEDRQRLLQQRFVLLECGLGHREPRCLY